MALVKVLVFATVPAVLYSLSWPLRSIRFWLQCLLLRQTSVCTEFLFGLTDFRRPADVQIWTFIGPVSSIVCPWANCRMTDDNKVAAAYGSSFCCDLWFSARILTSRWSRTSMFRSQCTDVYIISAVWTSILHKKMRHIGALHMWNELVVLFMRVSCFTVVSGCYHHDGDAGL